ncbi:MAG TPA: hypothetical protein PKI20_02470 [Verrucomicrobiota bacterium]|nr:hypothetical protein [Verrucomicrobiota bacterium]HQL76661.1 hypothetical protein [Verrucomicrobiota bacterium]
MRTEANGDVRRIWYGRFMVNGRRECVNLGVKMTGTPPASGRLRDRGDAAFEQSRGAAALRLKQVAAEARTVRDSARLVERLYALKTGKEVREVKLSELETEWAGLARRRALADKYAREGRKTLGRLVAFVRSRNRRATDLAHADPETVAAFMQAEKDRGVSGRTWNKKLKLLRSAFRHLLPSGAPNPFDRLVTREEAMVFRQPFTAAELRAILEAAKDDDFIRPIIVTGMCTAMRRGDCCLLKWKDVDLRGGFVTVKTAKTGGTVSIPIFGRLRDELAKRAEKAAKKLKTGKLKAEIRGPGVGEGAARSESKAYHGEGFVFPEAAAMYRSNPDGITRRVKQVLWAALAGGGAPARKGVEVPAEEVRRRGEAYLAGLPAGERTERLVRVFGLYMDGGSVDQVAKAAGVSQSSVSVYLNEIAAAIGCGVVRWQAGAGSVARALKADDSVLRSARAGGLRRASVRDFHSLRVTWVTLALSAGVPLELVQRVRAAIRHSRFGSDSDTYKDKFLNWWMGLEFLAHVSQGENIGRTVAIHASDALLQRYLYRLVSDLVRTLKGQQITWDADFATASGAATLNDLEYPAALKLLQTPAAATKLAASFGDNPVAGLRIARLATALQDPKKTADLLAAHHRHLLWQLSRLYRIRCCIVHGSQVRFKLPLFAANVEFYLKELITVCLRALTLNPHVASLREVFQRAAFARQRVDGELRATPPNPDAIRNAVFNSVIIQENP